MKYKTLLILLSSALLFTSCLSKKKILYLQGSQDYKDVSGNYEPIIQNDDKLSIIVTSLEIEAAAPFNLNRGQISNSSDSSSGAGSTYLVDNKGNIEFPVLGTISVSGYSVNELKLLLKQKLLDYIKDPVVNILITNFKVTVLGEVNSPGVKSYSNHRITLLDVLGSSGDLTYFGKRDNILIMRDYQGIKSFNRVDITKADFVNSPFYYLDQNDVIYVEPRKAKIDSTALPNLPIIVTVTTFLLSMLFISAKL